MQSIREVYRWSFLLIFCENWKLGIIKFSVLKLLGLKLLIWDEQIELKLKKKEQLTFSWLLPQKDRRFDPENFAMESDLNQKAIETAKDQ